MTNLIVIEFLKILNAKNLKLGFFATTKLNN